MREQGRGTPKRMRAVLDRILDHVAQCYLAGTRPIVGRMQHEARYEGDYW